MGEQMQPSRFALIIVATSMTTSVVAMQQQTTNKNAAHEQSDFGADLEEPDRPAAVPDEVVQKIREVRKAAPEELPAEWLVASEIHLDGPNEIDLVVIGTGGELRGAHVVPFWV